jgi:hypothetical protein
MCTAPRKLVHSGVRAREARQSNGPMCIWRQPRRQPSWWISTDSHMQADPPSAWRNLGGCHIWTILEGRPAVFKTACGLPVSSRAHAHLATGRPPGPVRAVQAEKRMRSSKQTRVATRRKVQTDSPGCLLAPHETCGSNMTDDLPTNTRSGMLHFGRTGY